MAEIKSIYTNKNYSAGRDRQAYIDGTAARKLREKEKPERRKKREEEPFVYAGRRTRTQHMGIGYVIFLMAALGVAMWVCVGYLQLQADNTARAKNIASLETQLSKLKDENDDEYNRVTTSVDLEKIRDIAVNELGMVYATEEQVVLYDNEGSDYVKQYADIPEDKEGLKGLLAR